MKAATNDSSSFSSFIDYKRVILTLSADLQRLRYISEKLNLENSSNLIDEVLKRIESDSFSVAVVGEFKRGKSTFINALLGQEILPADILPCSATLNRVTYGLKPLVKVLFKNGREEEVAIDRLADYVTKLTPESETTAVDVKEAVVYYPVHYCQNNVDIIDTPGLNDDQNMTDVTLSVLPSVDAALLSIMAQAPLSEYERDFLEDKLLTSDLGRIIFVVTGIDRFNRPEDGERVVNNIKERIKKYVLQRAEKQFGKDSQEYKVYVKKIGEPKVFGLSAYQALEAKRHGDATLLTQSRFPEFEAALEKFLTQERGAIVLQVPVNRVLTSSAEILKTISMQEGGLGMKQEDFNAAYEASVAELAALRKRKVEEMQKIDAATEQTRQKVKTLLNQLEAQLKQAAEQVIESTTITDSDLNKTKIEGFKDKLGRQVANAVRSAGQNLAEKIQLEIQQGLAIEVERLSDFTGTVDQTLHDIEMQFVKVAADGTRKTTSSVEAITAAVSVYTGWGGIWSGYRAAGWKGAGIGAAASFGTYFGAGLLIGLVGLPISWPFVLSVGITSFFTGDWLARKILARDLVQNFKANYKQAVFEEIPKQLTSSPINQKVNDYISDTFTALKQKLNQEIEALLNDTQNTLTDLRGQKERDETLTAGKIEEFNQMRVETQKIYENAQTVSEQLIQIMSV